MLGKKTMEAEILKEAVEIARSRKMDCALTLSPDDQRGWSVNVSVQRARN